MVFNCKCILYLLWKESLNKAGQQFHQYQQCEQLPFASISLNTKISWHMQMEIQILAWDRYNNVVGLNLSMRSIPSAFLIMRSQPSTFLIMRSQPSTFLIMRFQPSTFLIMGSQPSTFLIMGSPTALQI